MRTTWVPVVLLGGLVGGVGAIPAAAADDKPTAKELEASAENLKQIGIAFHNSIDANNSVMPTTIMDKDGKPLLSWRVAILPQIEQDNLYRQFKLDEPWDSENNKKLIAKMPKLYAPVRGKAKPGETYYQVFVGKEALFGPGKRPRLPASIPDGTSRTGLVFEAGVPVTWTKPDDLLFDADNPLPKLGGLFDGDFHVVLCDGSVLLLKKDADETELKRFITPADGFILDLSKLEKN
jgi:hypothetical protein